MALDTTIKSESSTDNDVITNNSIDGLIIRGAVAGRTKRAVGDKHIELITYKIVAGGNIFFVKDWAPKNYLPVGHFVELPITIKSYQTNGHVRIDYTICHNSYIGEEF